MFDLDQAISRWRKQIIADGIKSATILDELESHLRDQIEEQIRLGLTAADAFKIATQRLGQGTILKAEFAKLRRHNHGSLLWLFRLACFISAPFMLATSAWVLLASESITPLRLLIFLLISAMALYLGSLPLWYRFLPNPYRRGIGIALKTMSIFLGSFPVVALLDALGIIHFPGGDTVAMLGWSLLATHTGTIFAYACLDRERGLGWGLFDCPPHDKFTDLAQHAMETAYSEAAALGHDYVGTEHLLLGILSSESGLLQDILRKHGMNAETIRAEVEKVVGRGPARSPGRDIPYTPRAKKALVLALDQTRSMGHSFISTEHMFLGLLMENEGIAGLVLRRLGINALQIRRDILDGMGPDGDSGPVPVPA